jgi:hypothetical protein
LIEENNNNKEILESEVEKTSSNISYIEQKIEDLN